MVLEVALYEEPLNVAFPERLESLSDVSLNSTLPVRVPCTTDDNVVDP